MMNDLAIKGKTAMRDLSELSGCFTACDELSQGTLSLERLKLLIISMGMKVDEDLLNDVLKNQGKLPPFKREGVKEFLEEYSAKVKLTLQDLIRMRAVIQYAIKNDNERVIKLVNSHGTRLVKWKDYLIYSFAKDEDLDLIELIGTANRNTLTAMKVYEDREADFKKELKESIFIETIKRIIDS